MKFRFGIIAFILRLKNVIQLMVLVCFLGFSTVEAQIENVPVNNQVYEFLDRMGIKRILPLYSNVMIPLSRQEIAKLLVSAKHQRNRLNDSEKEFLDKFEMEFMHEIDPSKEDAMVLFRGSPLADITSDKEKYLYNYSDSSISMFVEFIGALEHRRTTGDTYGSVYSTIEEHGGRIRGTIKNRLGFYVQATNGTLYGNRSLALSDTRLKGNVKLNDLDSPYLDFAEAYLRADLDWFNLQFGREYNLVGTGYSDRLLLSGNAPVFDFLKLDFNYKSLRFIFLHGSLVDPYSTSNKYLAMHRVQFSLFDIMNIGASEMIIYQREAPDFAYLNPINFYKSSEHSLRDRDNAFINFDVELFPYPNYKLFGAWLIDDIDFGKMGTGWWGNEFAWQGGLYIADIANIQNVDGLLEYTRIEPYVYSNRLSGNSYSNNNIGLGHHLQPNSDEWFFQLSYRPMKEFRAWISYGVARHGENETLDGIIIKNVGGNILQGHRDFDSESVKFLDGALVKSNRFQVRAMYEPVTNFFVSGIYEIHNIKQHTLDSTRWDNFYAIRMYLEY
ncbi:MAG: hypothetical protein HY800_01365 [Ignavibacteriales bacterium]|nr:hypothetical protein [Ignavibacteriales bacterium]